jgi:cytochrome c oxidase subunit 3
MAERVAEHFENMATQAHAARLGMWLFLASEALFFAALFALYGAYRIEHPHGFAVGVEENTLAWGSVNTGVLLTSSYVLTLAVRALRRGANVRSAWLIAITMLLGTAFASIKIGEWLVHFREGVFPGGAGSFYETHRDPGTKLFYTLYFCMTGLHEVHVVVGVGVLGLLMWKVARGVIGSRAPYPLALGALYWHFVDLVWLFLWPLFYLIPGEPGR